MSVLQPRLFDLPAPTPRHRGDLDPEEWSSQPDVLFHGTFRGDDFRNAPSFHAGDRLSAETRLATVHENLVRSTISRSKYYNAYGDDVPELHTGRLYALRMPKEPSYQVNETPGRGETGFGEITADANANAADVHHWMAAGVDDEDIPETLKTSAMTDYPSVYVGPTAKHRHGQKPSIDTSAMSREALAASHELRSGNPINYGNTVEGGTSTIIPAGSRYSTWEQDVLASPNRSRMAKDYARQRIVSGRGGSVPFTDKVSRPLVVGYQRDIFGSEKEIIQPRSLVSEVQFNT